MQESRFSALWEQLFHVINKAMTNITKETEEQSATNDGRYWPEKQDYFWLKVGAVFFLVVCIGLCLVHLDDVKKLFGI